MTDVLDMQQKNGKKKALTSNMWMYALGVMGINLAIGLINSYQAEFFNKIFGANLMIIAGIILGAKMVSIIADFVIGNLIDRANFKAGKMRPWILFSAFPLAVFTMISFVFIDFGNSIGKYIYIAFVVVLWNVSMTMADIPSQGMLSLISKNPDDTNNAAGVANTLKSLALACPGVFITIVCMITGAEGGKVGYHEYLITAGVMAGLGLIFQLLMYFKCKEEVKSTVNAGLSFREMFRELKANKMILIVFATYILGFGRNIGLGIAVQASCILIRDGIDLSFIGMGVLRGDACSWAIGITSAVSSMVTIVLNPLINKKLGEKKYFITAGLYGFAVCLTGYLMYTLSPDGSGLRSIWAILIYQFFLGFSFGPNGYLPMVMTADIVDYQEWKTGKRTEGTQFAILSMSNKMSNALSVSIGILLIGAIGYSASNYSAAVEIGAAGSPENLAAVKSVVSYAMQNKTWAIYFLLPGLCMLASSAIMLFYKIDDKTKKQMRIDLDARHALALAGAGEGTPEISFDTLDGTDVLSQSEAMREIREREGDAQSEDSENSIADSDAKDETIERDREEDGDTEN